MTLIDVELIVRESTAAAASERRPSRGGRAAEKNWLVGPDKSKFARPQGNAFMHHLSPIDLTIIVGYFVVTLLRRPGHVRRASSSLNDYFLGGRSLPWYLLGIAGMTNWFDLTGTMIITSFLYMLGPRGLFIEFRGGAVLMLAFLIAYTGKWHRRSGCMTGAEWMSYRFGKTKSAEAFRVVQAGVSIVASIMMLAYLVRGASLFLGMLFPFPPMYSTLVLLMITSLYTVSAGFYGVVLTDLVQGLIVMCACVIVAVMAFHMVPSSAALSATALAVTHNPDWTASTPAFHVFMPDDYAQYRLLVRVMLFYLICQVLYGMGSGSETRYFAARSDRDCGLQSALQGITVAFRWPMMISFAIMGIYLVHNAYPDPTATQKAADLIHHAYPDLQPAYWSDRTNRIINVPDQYRQRRPGPEKNSRRKLGDEARPRWLSRNHQPRADSPRRAPEHDSLRPARHPAGGDVLRHDVLQEWHREQRQRTLRPRHLSKCPSSPSASISS